MKAPRRKKPFRVLCALSHSYLQNTQHTTSLSLSLLDIIIMSSWELQLVETAEEELEILRTQYPNRFAYLKSDLQSFISNLREDHAPPPVPSSALVLTQESSNCQTKQKHNKKRKSISHNIRSQSSSSSSSSSFHKNNNKMDVRREDRSEMVIQRAQICLRKIQLLKASLSSSFTN